MERLVFASEVAVVGKIIKTDRQLLMEVFLEEGVPVKLRKKIAKHLGSAGDKSGLVVFSGPPNPALPIPSKPALVPSVMLPSTQRLLEAQEASIAAATGAGILPSPIIQPPPQITAAKRIIGGQVNNGDGTSGKRKW